MKKLDFEKLQIKDGSLDKEISKAIEGLQSDPEVYLRLKSLGFSNLGQVKDNLAILLEYQDDRHVCLNCPGLDACPKSRSGYFMDLILERERVKAVFNPCSKLVEQAKKNHQYIKKDFPDDWTLSDLRVLKSRSNRRLAGLHMVRLAARKADDWLFLKGNKGAGKSYMMAVFSNLYAKTNPGVAFINTEETVALLRRQSIKEKRKFERNMQALADSSLLVFDGFGSESATEYVFDKIIEPLLSYRLDNNLLTGFTSKYSLDDALKRYVNKADSKKLSRLARRLKEKILDPHDVSGVDFFSES